MSEPKIEGVCPIIATPFTESGDVDYESLRREVKILAEGGCHAGILFGVVSEFFKLTDDERNRMVDVVTATAEEHDLPIVISVTHEATEVAVEWARQYEAAGADGLMVFPPSFMDPPADRILDHLRAIGDAVSVPVMVQYRRPENPVIPPATLAQLSEDAENIRYFKIETADSGSYISELHEEAGNGIDTLVGMAGLHMLDAFNRGSIGVIPAASLYDVYLKIYNAYMAGDETEALEIHSNLIPILNQISTAAIPYEKRILEKRGIIDTGYCREPVHASTDTIKDELLEKHISHLDSLLTA